MGKKEVDYSVKTRNISVFLIGAILLFSVFSLEVKAQELKYTPGIHLIRPNSQYITHTYSIPEFLSVEDMHIVTCIEDPYAVRTSILCLDNNNFEDLTVVQWSNQENCYLATASLEGFSCKNLRIQSEYTVDEENIKITRDIRVNKLNKFLDNILANQFSDGGWVDSLSTSYGVLALAYFKDIYEYELGLALDWLKDNRNDDEKCWPKAPCTTEITANVLALLTMSDYNESLRIVRDSANWLEERHNTYDEGDTWQLTIKPLVNGTTVALVAIETDLLAGNISLPLNESAVYSFNAYRGRRLYVLTDENVKMNISNEENELLYSYQGDNLSYPIPGQCWTLNKKGEPCYSKSTVYAVASGISDIEKDNAKGWMETQVKQSSLVGKFFGTEDEVVDTSLFLYIMYEDNSAEDYILDMQDWLHFKQHNDGSWGDGNASERIVPTLFSVMGLMRSGFNRTAETIEDAEAWVENNEDELNLSNTIEQAAAFYILKNNARPLITTNPMVVIVESPEVELEMFNPTTFDLTDLKYEFSENLKDILSVEEKEELNSYSYRRVTIKRLVPQSQTIYGFLTISNIGDDTAKIPVIITDFPSINITYPSSVRVFGKQGNLPLTVTKSAHTFLCSIKWDSDEIEQKESFMVTSGSYSLPVSFKQARTTEDLYSGIITCSANEKSYTIPVSVYFERYSSKPLVVDPSLVTLNDTGQLFGVSIKNKLDQDVTVSLSMDAYSNFFQFAPTVELDPNEEKNVTFYSTIPEGENITATATLSATALGNTETVSVVMDIRSRPALRLSPVSVLIILGFILVVFGVGGYLAYRYREKLLEYLNKIEWFQGKTVVKKQASKIKKLRKEEKTQAILNMYQIMKFQKKLDKEIKERLLMHFEADELKEALGTAGIMIEGLEEVKS